MGDMAVEVDVKPIRGEDWLMRARGSGGRAMELPAEPLAWLEPLPPPAPLDDDKNEEEEDPKYVDDAVVACLFSRLPTTPWPEEEDGSLKVARSLELVRSRDAEEVPPTSMKVLSKDRDSRTLCRGDDAELVDTPRRFESSSKRKSSA